MSVSASIPATVQIRRGHLLGLIGVARLWQPASPGGDRGRVRHRYVGSGVEQRLGVAAARDLHVTRSRSRLSTMAPRRRPSR